METKERGRHRLGGKHSDPITVPNNKKPRGAHAATKHVAPPVDDTEEVKVEPTVPPKPGHAPTVHTVVPIPEYSSADTKRELLAATTGKISMVKHRSKVTAITAIATGGLLIVGGSSSGAPVKADVKSEKVGKASSKSDIADPITVPLDVLLSQPRVEVKTKAAPPAVVAPPVAKEAEPVVAPVAPAPAPVTRAVPTPVATPPLAVAPTPSAKAGIIASAALAQVGRIQDCTMLVTNALAVAGINFHDWPAGYYGLGHAVSASEAIPGDLIYYSNGGAGLAHIAVYIGNGKAVHGGWNGNQTVVFSTNVGSGPSFIRVTA